VNKRRAEACGSKRIPFKEETRPSFDNVHLSGVKRKKKEKEKLRINREATETEAKILNA